MAKHILTTGKGKSKRQWELTDEEFEYFQMRFEENELADMSDYDFSKIKFTKVPAPNILTPVFND